MSLRTILKDTKAGKFFLTTFLIYFIIIPDFLLVEWDDCAFSVVPKQRVEATGKENCKVLEGKQWHSGVIKGEGKLN